MKSDDNYPLSTLNSPLPQAPRDVFTGDFDFEDYVRGLVESNRLALKHGFCFHVVSGLEGMVDALESLKDSAAFVAVSDDAFTSVDVSTAPSLMRQKTLFLAMRHAAIDDGARAMALHVLRELARQFLARMLHDRHRLVASRGVAFVPDVAVSESDSYLSPGTAILYMNIGYHFKASLVHDESLWANP